MTDRPIIFSAAMVRALLDGKKTQTRRLATSPLRKCEVGDRLYVREAHHRTDDSDDSHLVGYDFAYDYDFETVYHDIAGVGRVGYFANSLGGWGGRTSRNFPSIHMPRWASRLTLVVEVVRVERLQAIGEADAVAEGTTCYICDGGQVDGTSENDCGCFHSRSQAVPSYQFLWNSLHGPDSWDANPDVVALTFRVVRGNIDRVEG